MRFSHSELLGRLLGIWVILFLFCTPVPGYGAVTTSVSSGIALDRLEWTIGPSSSFPISELVFKSTSWQNSFNAQWIHDSNIWFLEGTAGFGYVFTGSVVDRDFSLPHKQGEFSRSESEINGHNSLLFSFDGGIGFGQPIDGRSRLFPGLPGPKCGTKSKMVIRLFRRVERICRISIQNIGHDGMGLP